MKILILNDSYSKEGGTEAYIQTVAEKLISLGHKVFLIVGASSETLPGYAKLITSLNKGQVFKFIDENKIDVAYFQTLESPDLYLALPSKLPCFRILHDTASVCKMHFKSQNLCSEKLSLHHCLRSAFFEDSMSKNPFKIAEQVGNRQLILKTLGKFKKLFANSTFTKNSYIREGVGENLIEVIPMFPTVTFGSVDKSALKLKKDNIILFSGRIFKEKGLEYLISAFTKVRKGSELWVVGTGWDQNRCKKLAYDLSLGEWVRFWGFLEKAKLAEVYSQSTIGVIPSVWGEPFGLSGIEMMSFGMPVVGFNSGGIHEWLKNDDNGFLVEPYDTEGLAEKINILLEDPQKRVSLGNNGQILVSEKYNIDKHVSVLLQNFESSLIKPSL